MPELPEVETIKNTLKRFIINKKIEKVTVYWPNIIKLPDDIEQFKFMLVGQTFQDVTRKGKLLLFHLDDYILISHLSIEGIYSVVPQSKPIKKDRDGLLALTNHEELRYNDVRKFGTMHVVNKGEELSQKPLSQLGTAPFEGDFTFPYFYEKLKRTDRVIKTVLFDQTIIAEHGSIYVDEMSFKAGVHMIKKTSKLTKKEAKAIQQQAIATLEEAVAQGGTTISSYVNGQGEMGMFQQELFVYGQEDEPCKNCGSQIVKMKIGGRGTHVCLT